MKTTTRCLLLALMWCITANLHSQTFVINNTVANADLDAMVVDPLIPDLTNIPLAACDFNTLQAGYLGFDLGNTCFNLAKIEGTLPDNHEVASTGGTRFFVDGDNSNSLRIIWKNTVAQYATSDFWTATGSATSNLTVNVGFDNVPPNTPINVFFRYNAFSGANTSHEGEPLDPAAEEDPISSTNVFTVNGRDMIATNYSYASPGGALGWNQTGDVFGQMTINSNANINVVIASTIMAHIEPLGKPNGFGFDVDQNAAIFKGEIEFRLTPFTIINGGAPSEDLIFSIDVGSDAAFADIQQNGNEWLDPGDVFPRAPNATLPAIPFLDDMDLFNTPTLPETALDLIPYHGVPLDLIGPIVHDLDGVSRLDFSIATVGGTYPSPAPASNTLNFGEYFVISFDDDTRENWTDQVPSLPVESDSPRGAIYGTPFLNDEINMAEIDPWMPGLIPFRVPLMGEDALHAALSPPPLSNLEDDDTDALGMEVIDENGNPVTTVTYFSVDHEGTFFHPLTGVSLDPGTIYEHLGVGNIVAVATPVEIGIPPGTDVDAFEWGLYGTADIPSGILTLFFSVDEDDPQTAVDESGGLDPRVIYASLLNGQAFTYSDPLEDDIDALALSKKQLSSGSLACNHQYYEDQDGDGFGDPNLPVFGCIALPGMVVNPDDCDDSDGTIYPGAPGTGMGVDNNCDGQISNTEALGCPGDFNGDLTINASDLLDFISHYPCAQNCAPYDLTGDGIVDTADLLAFLAVFGTTCP